MTLNWTKRPQFGVTPTDRIVKWKIFLCLQLPCSWKSTHTYTWVKFIFSNSHLLYCCRCWSKYRTLCQELKRAWPQILQFPILKGALTHLRDRPLKISMTCHSRVWWWNSSKWQQWTIKPEPTPNHHQLWYLEWTLRGEPAYRGAICHQTRSRCPHYQGFPLQLPLDGGDSSPFDRSSC